VNSQNLKIKSLLNLLQDDNPRIASLAMEQFLKREQTLETTLAHYQETDNPRLRQRLHQLGSILMQRRMQREFVAAVQNQSISLWRGICRLNQIYDPSCSYRRISNMVNDLRNELDRNLSKATRVAAFMKDTEFRVVTPSLFDIDAYLIESVLELRLGNSALLGALAQYLGWHWGNWSSTFILYEGRYCLIDSENLVVDPSRGWRIRKLDHAEKIHPCSRQDVWLGILSQMLVVALSEGSLRESHQIGRLLCELNNDSLSSLPYPLGDDVTERHYSTAQLYDS